MTTENCSNDINAFGREKLAYISNEDMDDIIDSVNSYDDACSTPSRLVKLIHFDPEHPENHNLKIKDDKAYIYDGNEWIEREKNESINQLVDKAFNMIVNYYTRRKQLYIEKNSFIKEQGALLELFPDFKQEIEDKFKKIEEIPIVVNPIFQQLEDIVQRDDIFYFYNNNSLFNYFELRNKYTNLKKEGKSSHEELTKIYSEIKKFEQSEKEIIVKSVIKNE